MSLRHVYLQWSCSRTFKQLVCWTEGSCLFFWSFAQVLFPFFFLCPSTCLQIDMRYAQRMLRIIIVVLTYCSISWTHMCNVIRGRCSPALCRAVMIPTDKLVQQVFIGLVNTRDLWLHVWDSNSATCSQRAFLLHTHSLWKILNDQQKTSLLSVITDSN